MSSTFLYTIILASLLTSSLVSSKSSTSSSGKTLYRLSRRQAIPPPPSPSYGPPNHTPGQPYGPLDSSTQDLINSANANVDTGYGADLGGSSTSDTKNTNTNPSPEEKCGPQSPQQNKENVIAFYEELFGRKNFASIDDYIGPMYIQHNPQTLDGKENLLKTLQGPFWSALSGYKIYRISAEDDLVWVQDRMDFGEKSFVFLDILRFECGKIVEHWDVIQPITGKEINPKAFF